jgi:hypothetical protein
VVCAFWEIHRTCRSKTRAPAGRLNADDEETTAAQYRAQQRDISV